MEGGEKTRVKNALNINGLNICINEDLVMLNK